MERKMYDVSDISALIRDWTKEPPPSIKSVELTKTWPLACRMHFAIGYDTEETLSGSY